MINVVFVEVVKLLHKQGYVQLDTVYIDGTKIEARANRYTFVWRKAVDTFDSRLDEKLRLYLEDTKRLAADEDQRFGDENPPEMGKEPVSS